MIFNKSFIKSPKCTPRKNYKICGCKKCQKSINRSKPLVGIITAFSPEITNIRQAFTIEYDAINYGGRLYYRGIIYGAYVIAVISGVSMTNATMTTQAMIDLFHPKNLIFSGIAGGINPANVIGTVILPVRVGQYQNQISIQNNTTPTGVLMDTFINDNVNDPDKYFTYGPNNDKVLSFERPNCDGCSNPDLVPPTSTIVGTTVKTPRMNIPIEVETFTNGTNALENPVPTQFFFYSSPKLLKIAQSIINDGIILPGQICTTPNNCYTPPIVIGDFGGSASTFLDNTQQRNILFNEFAKANVTFEFVDMESAAFAHCAFSNKVPFLVVRSLSDLAGNNASDQLEQFFTVAAKNSSFVSLSIIKKLSQIQKHKKIQKMARKHKNL